MDRDTILADFQACTGITDISLSISLLEAHDWELTAAVTSALTDGVSEADVDVEQLLAGSHQSMVTVPPPDPNVDPSSSIPQHTVRDTTGNSPRTHSRTSSAAHRSPHSRGQNMNQFGARDPRTNSSTGSQPMDTEHPVSSAAVLEKDTGPAASGGHVRILHFDIQLRLPSDSDATVDGAEVCSECFTFPDTETVGSLKRHFIELRLTELTLLATSPAWSKEIPEVTPLSLFAHLQFEPSGPHSFSDNSLTLRSLHLPKFNQIQAKFVHVQSQTDTEPSPRLKPSAHIELRIYVCHPAINPASATNDGVEFMADNREDFGVLLLHALRLKPNWRISQLRRDVCSLTEIPIARQRWSQYPPTGCGSVAPGSSATDVSNSPSSAAVERLVTELNHRGVAQRLSPSNDSVSPSSPRRQHRSTTPSSHTLMEIGLQPGNVYTLYVMESANESDFSLNSANHPSRSRIEASSSSQPVTANSKRTSTRKSIPSKSSDDHASDMEDDFDYGDDDIQEHYSSDELEQPRSKLWTDPLIPESHFGDDPGEATEKFCVLFLQRYCGDGATMAPPFATCSLDAALAASVGTPSVSERKPLFIYLHNDSSVACHVFCQQILCSPGLGQFLGDNGFCLWPWDVTTSRAKERLLGWLENKIPNLASVVIPLPVDSYPVLAMIGKVAGLLEVLCVVLGTGAVTHPLARNLDELDFPSLSATGRTSPLKSSSTSAMPAATGSLKPDVIVAELWQAYTNYTEVLAPEREAEAERLARQRVREEQEAAYQESLRQDQLKAIERAKAEEQERLERERLAREHDQQRTEAARHRLTMAAGLPPEPPAPNTPAAQAFLATPKGAAGIASLRFRLPREHTAKAGNQAAVLRRFAGLDTLKNVLDYVESQGFPVSEYKLLTTYPRRDLTTLDKDETLAALNLVPQETVTLEQR